jgi:hypothetical protein
VYITRAVLDPTQITVEAFCPQNCIPVLKKLVKFLAPCKPLKVHYCRHIQYSVPLLPTFNQKNPVRALQFLFLYDLFEFHSIYAKSYQALLHIPVSQLILRMIIYVS